MNAHSDATPREGNCRAGRSLGSRGRAGRGDRPRLGVALPGGKLTFSEITPSQLTFARAALTFPVLLGAGMIVGGVTLANINRR